MRTLLSTLLLTAMAVPPALATGTPGIDWHTGDPQAAFDLAMKEKKPLFLYWGAVWCPPCNQMKKTIFTRREFIEKTKLFIPVYLDGDTESAQVWGEKLGASGYPTMIVMSPEGKEVMRLPTGLQLQEFLAVLDEALGQVKPIKDVLEEALTMDAAKVPDSDYRLLAFYSWGQDESVNLSEAEREQKFRALEARVPDRLKREKSRIWALWLSGAIDLQNKEVEEGAEKFSLSEAQKRDIVARLSGIFDDPALLLANLDLATYYSAEVVKGLYPDGGDARDALVKRWLEVSRAIESNESLSVDERISAIFPAIELNKLVHGDEAAPPAELVERVRARAAWAQENATDVYTRQAAMSTAGYLLGEVGLADEARKLYLKTIETAVSPHYFMSSLASMAKKAGDNDEAIHWHREAYEKSEGRATRFQWGTSYLMGLMSLAPQDGERIRSESSRVLKELLGFDDAFAGRNMARVNRLGKEFAKWNEDGSHDGELASLRGELKTACAKLPADPLSDSKDESMRGRCDDFFSELGKNKAAQ